MESNRTILIVLVVLALIGLGFFVAYRNGDNDHPLRNTGDEIRDSVRDAAHDTKDAAHDAADDIRDSTR
jgi:hypothetical protein